MTKQRGKLGSRLHSEMQAFFLGFVICFIGLAVIEWHLGWLGLPDDSGGAELILAVILIWPPVFLSRFFCVALMRFVLWIEKKYGYRLRNVLGGVVPLVSVTIVLVTGYLSLRVVEYVLPLLGMSIRVDFRFGPLAGVLGFYLVVTTLMAFFASNRRKRFLLAQRA